MKNKIIFKTLMLKGEAGSTIVSMEKTGHVGTADIYTITFNDGSTTEISLENMSAITSVEKTSSTDTEDIYTITCADGSTQTFSVLNHNADIAAMYDDIDTIDARVDNFINSVVPNTVETLWTGSIGVVGDSATLSKAVSNFDYIDLYLLESADSKYIRVPATQTAVQIQQQNLSDDASSNFLRLWEMGVSISGSTVSITKLIAWAWDDPNNSNPTVTANAQNGVPITRIDGVKVASDTPAEVTDIRVGADGTTYNSAGAAVRGQISDLKEEIQYNNNVISDGYIGDFPTQKTGFLNADGDIEVVPVNNGVVVEEYLIVEDVYLLPVIQETYFSIKCCLYDENMDLLSIKYYGLNYYINKILVNLKEEEPTAVYYRYAVSTSSPSQHPVYKWCGYFATQISFAETLKSDIEDINTTINNTIKYVTPQMFGAVGDGVHDDTSAIQQAFDHTCKHVVIPSTDNFYKITDRLYIRQEGLIIEGSTGIGFTNGGHVTIKPTSNIFAVMHLLDTAKFVQIKNIIIECDSKATYGLIHDNSGGVFISDLYVENVFIKNAVNRGAYLGCVYKSIFNNLRTVYGRQGIVLIGAGSGEISCTSCMFNSCYSDYASEAGFVLENVVYSSFISCAVDHSPVGYSLNSCIGVSLISCGCESSGTPILFMPSNFKSTNISIDSFTQLLDTETSLYDATIYCGAVENLTLKGVYHRDTDHRDYVLHTTDKTGSVIIIDDSIPLEKCNIYDDSKVKFLSQ